MREVGVRNIVLLWGIFVDLYRGAPLRVVNCRIP